MAKLKITCSHCSHVTSIDSEKVPDRPVAYKCPSCKGRIVVDKKKLLAGTEAPAAAQTPVESQASAPQAGAGEPTLPTTDLHIEELALPPGESLPLGFILAEDDAAANQLIEQLGPFECVLERMETVDEARRKVMADVPPLIVYVAKEIGEPPFAALAQLLNLPPRERRETFIMLVGEDATTMDGNQAFLFQVNLLLATEHIPKAPGILYSALRFHHRLYKPYFAALGELE